MRNGARSARQLVRDTARRLKQAGVPEPTSSAEVLLSELLEVRRGELAFYDEPLSEKQTAVYEAWISRRLRREPVQRILGYAYFRKVWLELDDHTLIPRSDTESVVDAVLEAVDRRNGACRVLDLGTGSGAIAVSIAQERPTCDVHATDRSEGALKVARRNAARAGATIRFYEVDLASGLDALVGSVDVLVSNPPYIRSAEIEALAPEVRGWDPRAALDGGPDGLDFYRRIFAEAGPLLKDGADLVLEVGDGQAEKVLGLGRCAGYVPLGTRPDLTGTPRTVLLRRGSG
jgi:release factor glutamine methyltransferase